MAESNEATSSTGQNLSSLFHEGLELYNKINNTQEPMNCLEVQVDIKRCMRMLEQATRIVSIADIFSKNEGIEELATNHLQYLLLPAMLGFLAIKLTSGERKDNIDVAEIYFLDFLKRTNEYGLSNYEFKKSKSTEESAEEGHKTDFELLSESVNTRANKIQRFRQQKELKAQLADLKRNVENEHADEELKRNYFLTMVKVHIHEVVDEVASIEMEKPILEHMARVKAEDKDRPIPKREPPPPLKPIIITRDEVQKAVYGAGYPALPILTVQEFYDKRVADGVFPDPTKPKSQGQMSLQEAALAGVPVGDQDQEDEEKERVEEQDDEEYIEKMRERDEWRDDHRRGWGNRMNRS